MAGVILFCRLCHAGYGSTGEVPTHCPSCLRETKWSTSPMRSDQSDRLVLTVADRRLLRGLRIAAE